MALKRVEGDLLKLARKGQFDFIVHGCNAQGVMGSGIAKQVREQYPLAFEQYKRSGHEVGTYSIYDTGLFSIINAVTQDHYLPRGKDHFRYGQFERMLHEWTEQFPGKRFGFPYIGMGLAGGNSVIIFKMLEAFGRNNDATLVKYVP